MQTLESPPLPPDRHCIDWYGWTEECDEQWDTWENFCEDEWWTIMCERVDVEFFNQDLDW